MNENAGHLKSEPARLYDATQPFDRRRIEVGDGHTLYLEQSGNPAGQPVIVLHGGPGGGCSPAMRRFFDPDRWRVVMFDQRGCGQSTPHAEITANTTAHLVQDIALICDLLALPPVILFGGSWGATLALTFAQAHTERVAGLVLRGVFLGRQAELDWFYGSDGQPAGPARFYPKEWAQFIAPIPEDERGDMIAAYHRRLFGTDYQTEVTHAQHWARWENALASVAEHSMGMPPASYARAFARLECHYFHNRCFLDEGQLLRDLPRMAHLPGVIVQGRCDMICPPQSAYDLAAGWPLARLQLIPGAGHAMTEPGIAAALVRAMNHWPR
ncbi:MAG: prolyl aminopeptidase [Paracoccus sp. (in: a-proteobacteria)]|uniref:prolyl aminopeptidase n=1 Tax=Paracoccus sp. TaxID=267 RepID=UPI0026E046EA|nr:prolyl aminopeptidase [Paracoccus sp. (in: a-proteobacteria)]MDO5621778.1 prolyl aminopeptidase [Paracoccus sp. (in: a-proteobacteria)]